MQFQFRTTLNYATDVAAGSSTKLLPNPNDTGSAALFLMDFSVVSSSLFRVSLGMVYGQGKPLISICRTQLSV